MPRLASRNGRLFRINRSATRDSECGSCHFVLCVYSYTSGQITMRAENRGAE